VFTAPDGTPLELPDPACAEADARAVLAAGDIDVLGRMPWSSNGTFLCVVRSDGLDLGAIYKPQSTERPLWDFPEGTLYRREVAAFVLSDLLGWDIVPTTVVRESGPLGAGSLQRFVAHDPNEHYFTLLEDHEDRFRAFAAFDILANNTDRKGGHCLRSTRTDAIVGIDHGLTFHAAWKLRTVIWEFGGEPIPEPLRDDVARIRPELEAALQPYLSSLEIASALMRADALLNEAIFPEADDDYRSYPWPLV